MVLPQKPDVDAILAFGRDAGGVRHLLIHCHAGISRSTAAMLMILAQAIRPSRGRRLSIGRSDPAAGVAELPDGRVR